MYGFAIVQKIILFYRYVEKQRSWGSVLGGGGGRNGRVTVGIKAYIKIGVVDNIDSPE